MHSTSVQTLSKINQQQWDYVVLQAQSQEPSFPASQVASDTYPYATILVDSIESHFSCTEPLFLSIGVGSTGISRIVSFTHLYVLIVECRKG